MTTRSTEDHQPLAQEAKPAAVAGLMSGVPTGFVYLPGGVVHGLAFVWLGAWMLRERA